MPEESHWVDRFHAVGRAQSRYLYSLLVVCLFFWALYSRLASEQHGTALSIPIAGIEIDGFVVLASGPVVISLVLLAALGTFPAIRTAQEKIGALGTPFEALDTSPTAIDFIVYSRHEGVRRLALLSYPFALTLALVEAVWLWNESRARPELPGHSLFVVVGALLLVWSTLRLVAYWWFKMRHMFTGKRPA